MDAAVSSGAGGPGGGVAITVLGNSGSYAGPGTACSGYLLRSQGFTLWLDAGPGTLANLQTHVRLADVDAVVVSHSHPDHWSDLEGFFIACRWIEPRSHVPIYAPAELPQMMRSGPDVNSTFDWHQIADQGSATLGPFRLRFARTDHPPETLAVRIDTTGADGDPVAFGYTADTGPAWSLDALGTGLDLVICEATFLQQHEGTSPHLSARQAGRLARDAGVRRLLITHIWPIVDRAQSAAEAAAAFGGPVECCEMHASYCL
ncbi:MAG: MBL fold metallo-hydrolase [Acidimicrobiales bacterium]